MENDRTSQCVWYYSLIYPLYPLLKDYAYISEESNENPYSVMISFFEQQNPFFLKYRSDDNHNFNIILLIAEMAAKLSVEESGRSLEAGSTTSFKPLQSVFSGLFHHRGNGKAHFPIKPLSLSNIMPTSEDSGDIEQTVSMFLNELKKINHESQLVYLLEKYFWSISSSKAPDISLYDEMKTTSAIAACLYAQYEQGLLELSNPSAQTEQFLLINGDVSGIQRFIFNIPSKGAAKSLKGRSVYIGLLSDVIVRHLLDELDLYETNLLYNGGGTFFILAPAHLKERLTELRANILHHLLVAHDGDLYFAIDAVPVKISDFAHFTHLWDKVKGKANRLKKRKWSELGLESYYTDIFGPLDDGSEENQVCSVCGSFGNKHPVHLYAYDEGQQAAICSLCQSFMELTNQLRQASFLTFKRINQSEVEKRRSDYSSYSSVFSQFGYEVKFSATKPVTAGSNERCYALNDTKFVEHGCSGFLFGAYVLPQEDDRQLTFEELAKLAVQNGRGDQKIAHLKLDVDNLGALFRSGLGEKSSVSRVSALSRLMGLYFEGYINQLIKEKNWEKHLYVVFSGGDDTYVVGTWDKVFQFAEAFYSQFRRYTGENPYVTFSAAINVFNYQFPVIRAAELTEHALDNAKDVSLSPADGLPPIKNKITFLRETFNWAEFKQIKAIYRILKNMVNQHDNQSILHKVSRSTLGFRNILQDSTQGKFRNIKFWRLAYYLREIKRAEDKGGENYVEQLIEQYRKIVIHNLLRKDNEDKIHQIMIIPAAIKWAQLAMRKDTKEESQ